MLTLYLYAYKTDIIIYQLCMFSITALKKMSSQQGLTSSEQQNSS